MTDHPLTFRWLGVAGIELIGDGFSLLIDPYVTRIPLTRFFFGAANPDRRIIAEKIRAAHAVLVTHSHFDHLMDVPVIVESFNCPVYGTANTCVILESFKVSPALIHEITPGDKVNCGPFRIEVGDASHSFVPFFKSTILPTGSLPPRRAFQYRLDRPCAFRISLGKNTVLTDPGSKAVKDAIDILFISPLLAPGVVRHVLRSTDARMVIPIHCDNCFKPITYSSKASGWDLFPLKRVSLHTLTKYVLALTPRGRFFLPKPFEYYRLEDILQQNGLKSF